MAGPASPGAGLTKLDMMAGAPPFPPGAAVTLANWQEPPFNRWGFQHVRELIPTARIGRNTGLMRRLPRGERELGEIPFRVNELTTTVDEFLARSYTDAFLVLHQGRVITELYYNGMTADSTHLLMSVSKSITATVAGLLIGSGALDPGWLVADVVPELARTSFSGATVQQLLDMRTGTQFSEDYEDLQAEVRTCEEVYLWRPRGDGPPLAADALEYFGTLRNDGPHGGPFRYRSILTDVLGWVLERASGERLHRLIERELWRPLGAEFDAEITVDGRGNAMADGGICAALRDVGRFGQLYLDRGRVGSRQVLPERWIDDTIRGAPDGAGAFAAGGYDSPGWPRFHYRNNFWVREPELPFFHASGINGQHVFVHAPSELVVVKLSTWPTATSQDLLTQTVAAVVAIAEWVSGGRVLAPEIWSAAGLLGDNSGWDQPVAARGRRAGARRQSGRVVADGSGRRPGAAVL